MSQARATLGSKHVAHSHSPPCSLSEKDAHAMACRAAPPCPILAQNNAAPAATPAGTGPVTYKARGCGASTPGTALLCCVLRCCAGHCGGADPLLVYFSLARSAPQPCRSCIQPRSHCWHIDS